MNKTRTLLCALLLVFGHLMVHAQGFYPCPGQNTGFGFCDFTCIHCDFGLNGIQGETFFPLPKTEEICKGDILLENPVWYGFIAGSASLTLEIVPLNCNGADGLQAAIVQGCNNSIVCEPGAAGGAAQTLTLTTFNQLVPGQPYQLVVDGFNANSCKFLIKESGGTTIAPPLGDLGAIQGPTKVCPKAEVTYTVPPVENATTYTWTAPTGSKVDGKNTNTIVKSGGDPAASVNVVFGTTGGQVCVTVSNICDPPKTTCFNVTNTALLPTPLSDRVLCFEELPFEWDQEPYPVAGFPGTYIFTSSPYTSYLGCDSTVRQRIIVKPRKQKTLPIQRLCEGDCLEVNGTPYCAAGTYEERFPAADGCDSTVNFTIVPILNKAVVQQKTDTLTCARTSVRLTSAGSTPRAANVTYKWVNSAGQTVGTTDTIFVSAPGIYSLIVTSVGAGKFCRDTAKVTVVGSTAVPNASAGAPKLITCATVETQLQGSGSAGNNFTYQWTASPEGNIVSGSTTLTPTVNRTGTYTLLVTNTTNGCTATSFVSVTADLTPPSLSVQSGEFNCEVTFFTLNATTNAGNPTYNWAGPGNFSSTQPSPFTNVEGTYYLTITDNGLNGCTATASATVTANNAPPGATATGASLSCAATSVTINGNSSAPNSTYSWTGPNGFTSTLQNPSVTAVGVYTLKVTAGNFCTSTATATVSVNNTQPGAALSASGNLHCNAASVNLVVNSTANPNNLGHVWTLPDGSTVITGKLNILSVNQVGAYSVVVTDSLNGCTSTASVSVVSNSAVTASASLGQDATCFGSANGSAAAAGGGGNGNFAYTWSNTQTTASISGLVAGTYTVTVNDGNNCTATASVTINQPTLLVPNASATAQTANLAADGTATAAPAGGISPYTYIWNTSGTTASITDLLPGNYTVTVADANNCTAVQTVTVNAYNCAIQASVAAVNVKCNGAADGTATANVVGGTSPFTYAWSNGATTPSVSGLAPGQYTVAILDAANCPSQASFSISQPNVLVANATATRTSGPTATDGTATAGPTGGTAGYTYVWSNTQTTASIAGLAPGQYTVTVTDANNCTTSQTVEVTFIDCAITSNVAVLDPLCVGQANGSATVVLTGGTTPFGYQWNNGGTSATNTGLVAGTYTVTATDANGCTLTATATLTDPSAIVVTIDNTVNPECPSAATGSVSASATGGTGTLGYLWNNGQNTASIINLVAGTYTVTATDANGCKSTQTATLQAVDNAPPTIAQTTPATLSIPLSGTVTLTQQNMNLQVADNCALANVSFSPTNFNCDLLGARTVTVTATDASGNTSTASFGVTVVDDLAPILTCPNSVIRCAGDNVVNYQAPTVSDNCIFGGSFKQTTGLASGATFPQGITLNTYTYTDKSGNAGSCTFEVNVLAPLAVTVVSVTNDVNNQNTGAIDISVNGGLAPYSFQWQKDGTNLPGGTTEDLTGLGAGIYTVQITDANDCTFSGPTIPIMSSGTKEPEWAAGFSIRPNPTPGHAEVVFPQIAPADIHLFVYDQVGRQVTQLHWAPQQRLDLDFHHLPSGTYTLLLRVGAESVVRKIVVSR